MRVNAMILILASSLITGCAPKPTSGVVGWAEGAFSLGSFAPDIPFTSADGERTTFHEVREPIALVAFAGPSAEACCRLRPELLALTERFRILPVTIAQVSVPPSRCPHGASCTAVCNLGATDLVSLCDADRIAWNAYERPNPGTVFLIDENSRVMQIGSVDNLEVLADKAEELADAVDEQRFGIGSGD